MQHRRSSASALVALCACLALACGTAGAQSDVSITFNGAPLNLNPAPQERSGRVFVPLRGVFERLGASVVYDNGAINAQGRGRSVSLRVGSTQAVVDGQQQTLDVAPFIIGASTYVPLRFVSQALGASVNYDASNRSVALADGGPPQGGRPPRMQSPPQARQPQRSPLEFAAVFPARNQVVTSRRPTIEADFGRAQADPNSIRVQIDGLNVTDQSTRSPRGVVYSPRSDLQAGRHTVTVAGVDANGLPFNDRWTFSSGTAAVSNTITNLHPGNGTRVRDRFTVSGHTMPGARVIVQVGTVSQPSAANVIGQLLGVGVGGASENVRSEVTADGNGNFTTPISIQAHAGQELTLVVDSTDARTRASAPRVVRNLTVE